MGFKMNPFLKKVRSRQLKLAFAESMTCGLVSHKLNTIRGTADIFSGSIICYDKNVKISLLKVSPLLIIKHSPVSKQVTEVLARNLSHLIKANIFGAITGLATSDAEARHPKGTAFLSVYNGTKVKTIKKVFRGTPLQIKKKAVTEMFQLIDSVIK